ncbi:MAG: hypothetical protein F6K21_29575 [Symploca sp. SIO2D2]|nr:hypothetical protein [Symploca sp. SIO2D2]
MRPLSEFIEELKRLDIRIWAKGDRLAYDAPSGVVTKGVLEEMKLRKAELLGFLGDVMVMAAPTLRSVELPDRIPLSFSQEHLCVLDQIEGGGVAYNMSCALEIHPIFELNRNVLEEVLREILQRHHGLRSCFPEDGNGWRQLIKPLDTFEFPYVDLRETNEERREAELESLYSEQSSIEFDLQNGPLYRFILIRMDDGRYVLINTIHHTVMDGLSWNIFIREVIELYDSFILKKPCPWPEMAIQYTHFSVWQRQCLDGERLRRLLAYWGKELHGVGNLELPLDFPRKASMTFVGATVEKILPADLDLETYCKEQSITLYSFLFAAYHVLLASISGNSDVVVGTSSANRNRVELEGLMGYFINTLAIRSKPLDWMAFDEFLSIFTNSTADAFSHQDLPFEKLLAELKPERQANRTPIFQVFFAIESDEMANPEEEEQRIHYLYLAPSKMSSGTAHFDLSMSIHRNHDNEIGVSLNYNSDLFKEKKILGWLDDFVLFLQRIVQDSNITIGELRELYRESEADRKMKLLNSGGIAKVGMPRPRVRGR